MAGRRTWMADLVRRCEVVGWQARRTADNHYFITADDGESTTLGGTPGDVRAQRNAEAWCKRHGLEALEREQRQARLRRRVDAIAVDRRRNEAATVVAARQAVEAPVPSEVDGDEESMRKTVAKKAGALGYVELPPKDDPKGTPVRVAVMELAPAMLETPVSNGPRPMKDAHELLLADERVVYRCERPAAYVGHPDLKGTCNRTFGSVRSLFAHVSFHSRTTLPITPGQRRKAEHDPEYAAQLEMDRTALEDVAADAAARRKEKPEVGSKVDEPASPGAVARIATFDSNLVKVAEILEGLSKVVDQMRNDAAKLADDVAELDANDDVREKARRYDELRKLMG